MVREDRVECVVKRHRRVKLCGAIVNVELAREPAEALYVAGFLLSESARVAFDATIRIRCGAVGFEREDVGNADAPAAFKHVETFAAGHAAFP
jgi:hypothetical protein